MKCWLAGSTTSINPWLLRCLKPFVSSKFASLSRLVRRQRSRTKWMESGLSELHGSQRLDQLGRNSRHICLVEPPVIGDELTGMSCSCGFRYLDRLLPWEAAGRIIPTADGVVELQGP